MENSRNKQFISFKLHAVLRSVMKSHAIPLHPTLDMNHPLVQHIHGVYTARSLVITVICPSHPAMAIIMAQDSGSLQADDLASDISPEGQQSPNAMSHCPHHSPHFISSHRHFTLSHYHKKKGEYSPVRSFERETTFT